MASTANWSPLEPDLKTVFANEENPIGALAEARIPAIVLRRAYNPDHCAGLIQRFIERGMMRAPEDSNPESEDKLQFVGHTRIDIGTSLVNHTRGHRGASKDDAQNREGFLQHAAVEGSTPRIVLATFIGYSEDDDEIFVWA